MGAAGLLTAAILSRTEHLPNMADARTGRGPPEHARQERLRRLLLFPMRNGRHARPTTGRNDPPLNRPLDAAPSSSIVRATESGWMRWSVGPKASGPDG